MSLLCNVATQRAADASSRETFHVALSDIACFPCATVWLRARTVAHRRPGELRAGEPQSWETGIYEIGEPGQVQMSPCFKLFGFIARKCGSVHPCAYCRPGRNCVTNFSTSAFGLVLCCSASELSSCSSSLASLSSSSGGVTTLFRPYFATLHRRGQQSHAGGSRRADRRHIFGSR